ncbi:MAG: hypothetical protein L0271_13780 [Gemmatimonadetes bacterium]|nr:hypothetical protein [Gemmatimonadota bacterium]
MRTIGIMTLLVCVLPAGLQAQGGRRGQMQMNRRAQLESRIVERFVEQSGREIGLDDNERRRVEQWLQDSQERRRELARDAADARLRLMDAVRDPRTEDAVFARILDDLDGLREREHQMWKDDQKELSVMLSPRKRAQFTVRLLRLQETIRGMIERRDSTGSLLEPTGGEAVLDGTPGVDPITGAPAIPRAPDGLRGIAIPGPGRSGRIGR